MHDTLTIPRAVAAATGPDEAWPLLWLLRQSASVDHRPIATTYARLAVAWHCTWPEARARLAALVDAGALRYQVRSRGKRKEGLTLHVWRPDPPTTPRPAPKSRRAPRSPQRNGAPLVKPSGPPLPKWASSTRLPEGETRHGLAQAVTDVVDAIRWPACDKPAKGRWGRMGPWASKTDAVVVLALLRATDETLTSFVETMRRIAVWARESDDGMAAQDLRGEERPNGTDRSRSVGTLCVQSRYGDRKRLAEAWDGRHTHSAPAAPQRTRRPVRGLGRQQ